MSKRNNLLAYILMALGSVAYLVITLLAPINPGAKTYGLSYQAIHWLELTIVLPLVVIWFVALWGSLRFKHYAQTIKASMDGKALNQVANGLLVLVTSLVITTLLQSARPIMIAAGSERTWTIATNYLAIALALMSFWLIFRGAWQLAAMVKFRSYQRGQWLGVVVLIVLGVVYVWTLSLNQYRDYTPNPSAISSYYLSDWQLLVSVVLPYIVIWYFGLMSAVCLRIYQSFSDGIIYRAALSRLSWGLLAIIAASILIQLVVALGPAFTNLGFGGVLLLLYGLIVVYALGHVLVAVGARKLSRIEEAT